MFNDVCIPCQSFFLRHLMILRRFANSECFSLWIRWSQASQATPEVVVHWIGKDLAILSWQGERYGGNGWQWMAMAGLDGFGWVW